MSIAPRPIRRAARGLLAFATLAALMATAGCGSVIRASSTATVVEDWRDGATLDVESRNGGLRVERTGSEAAIRIEAEITCGGGTVGEAQDRADATVIETRWTDPGRLEIEPRFPGGRRNGDAASMTITLPAGAAMSEVRLRSSNGSLALVGTEGRATLRSSNGRITLDGHDGPVEGSTSNGRLVLRNVRHAVSLTSSNGSISAELAPGAEGPLELRTSNGSVRIVVPADMRGSLRVGTSNGDVDVSGMRNLVDLRMSGRSATFVFTEDGPSSSVTTSNGDLTVIRRETKAD